MKTEDKLDLGFEIKKGVLVKYYGRGGDVVIPEEVTAIGLSAFYGCDSLRSVRFCGETVSIGAAAFEKCGGLKEVIFPSGLKRLGSRVFALCKSLVRVELPEGAELIGDSAFEGCGKLSYIDLPCSISRIGRRAFFGTAYSLDAKNMRDGFLMIGENIISADKSVSGAVDARVSGYIAGGAFEGCESITEVMLPEGLPRADDYLFCGCEKLVKVNLPKGMTEIGEYAFKGCEALEQIVIPPSVKKIGEGAFYQSGLKECILPPKLLTVSEKCFLGCESLVRVVFPPKLKKIKLLAFGECGSLKAAEFPETLVGIGVRAFAGCRSLERIFIPAKVTDELVLAFSSCSSLKEISADKDNPVYFSHDGVLYYRGKVGIMLCKYPEGKTDETFRMIDQVAELSGYAAHGCRYLRRIVYSPNIRYADLSAVGGSERLEEIIVSDGSDTVLVCPFGCEALRDVFIPKSVKSIQTMFWNFPGLRLHVNCNQAKGLGGAHKNGCFISAVRGFLYDRSRGIISQEETAEWTRLIADNLHVCIMNIEDDYLFYSFLAEGKMLTRRTANSMLEKSRSLECRAVLLNYLNALHT